MMMMMMMMKPLTMLVSLAMILLMIVWQPHITFIDGKAGGDHPAAELHVFMSQLEGSRYQSTFHLMVTIPAREGSRPGSGSTIEVFSTYSRFS